MHIHGNPMNFNVANLHPAGAAEKAAATQRAAEVRKKLLQGNVRIAEESDFDAVLMVGRWNQGGSQDGRQPEHPDPRANQSGTNQSASNPSAKNHEPGDHPVSLWA